MADSFRDRLKRLHDAHRRGKDSEDGPSGVYRATGENGDDDRAEADEATGYGWQRLGAERTDRDGQTLWVATEKVAADSHHGRWPVSQWSPMDYGKLADLDGAVPAGTAADDLLYMDTETSGLGPRALAFMIGLGYWANGQFVVEQLLIDDEADEAALLKAFAQRLERFKVLVTFNGKRFDVPLLQRRFEEQGLSDCFESVAHLDLLPLSRRAFPDMASHRLVRLEEEILGFERVDDVPGSDIPPRWWRFQKSKNSKLMKGVLEHNRHDVVSMQALVATAIAGKAPEAAVAEGSSFDLGRLGIRGLGHRSGGPTQSRPDAPGSVADKLERTYRLRGKFARRDATKTAAGTADDKVAAPPAATPPQSDNAPAIAQRLSELRSAAQGLVAQSMWREASALLTEIVALAPEDTWALQNLAEYYRREGNTILADALSARAAGDTTDTSQ